MKSPSCIYKIYNKVNRHIYIGSTKSFLLRKQYHLDDLKRKKHCNHRLQRDYNKGIELIFEIMEVVDDITKLLEREQYYINRVKPKYNIVLIVDPKLFKKPRKKKKKKVKIKITVDTWYPDRRFT